MKCPKCGYNIPPTKGPMGNPKDKHRMGPPSAKPTTGTEDQTDLAMARNLLAAKKKPTKHGITATDDMGKVEDEY